MINMMFRDKIKNKNISSENRSKWNGENPIHPQTAKLTLNTIPPFQDTPSTRSQPKLAIVEKLKFQQSFTSRRNTTRRKFLADYHTPVSKWLLEMMWHY